MAHARIGKYERFHFLLFINFITHLLSGSHFKAGIHKKFSPAKSIKITTIKSKIAFIFGFMVNTLQAKPNTKPNMENDTILQV
jgi:hypothetical protein